MYIVQYIYTVAISIQMDQVEFFFWSQSIILACISDKGWKRGSKSWANVVEIYTSGMERRWLFLIPFERPIRIYHVLSQHLLFSSTWPGVFFPSTAFFRCLAILAPPNHDWQWKYWHGWSTGRKPHRVAKDERDLYGLLVPKMRRGLLSRQNDGFAMFCPMYFETRPQKGGGVEDAWFFP